MLALDHLPTRRFRPLRRAEFEHLVEAGFFRDEQVELLYGRLVEMSPQGRAHAYAIQQLTKLLVLGLRERAEVRIQLPFAALDDSEPEPDIAIVAPGEGRHTHPSKAFLIAEVAETSLADDRIKGRIYASAGVPEYWIVNLVDSVIEKYTRLESGGFSAATRYGVGEALAVPCFGDVVVSVAELLTE